MMKLHCGLSVWQKNEGLLLSNSQFLMKWKQQLLKRLRSQTINAAVNGNLELPLLKDRQRFDAISTSNLEVYKFRDW